MIKIYDTATKKKRDFKPLVDGKVGMYVCGPTVYDVPHLGHGRSAVCFDVIRRYFIFSGFDVNFVSNYTDIDDKMINRAAEEGISVEALTKKVVPAYEEDYGKIAVLPADIHPYATEHVEEMIEIVKVLEEKGHIYVLDDGVYFDVSSYAAYGEFSGQELENLRAGARVAVKDGKRTPYDFVLWKFKKDGEPYWESPWGQGRPGWHIECSAMSWKHLGKVFDIHGGGLDLTFPHHECEVAQSQGAFGADSFARYWIHNGFIKVDDEKMSKSLNNFFTLRDVFAKYDPQVVRFMFLQTHYRNPINFSDILLDQAKAGLLRLHDFVRNLEAKVDASVVDLTALEDYQPKSDGDVGVNLDLYEKRFIEFMDNDFDTSGALGVIFDLVKDVNVLLVDGNLLNDSAIAVLALLKKFDSVLAVIFNNSDEVLPEEIVSLIAEREKVRADKNWAKSDELRDELLNKGYAVEDTPNGTIWKKV